MEIEKATQNKEEAKADSGKPKLSLVPRQIIFDIAKVREFGTKKYHNPENWRCIEVQRYRDAAFRHFMAYLDDPYGVDEESGISHLSHLACNIAFLCEMEHVDEIVTEHNKEALRKAEADIEKCKRTVTPVEAAIKGWETDIMALRKEVKTDIEEAMDAVKKDCEDDIMAVQERLLEHIQDHKQNRIRELEEELKQVYEKAKYTLTPRDVFFDIEKNKFSN